MPFKLSLPTRAPKFLTKWLRFRTRAPSFLIKARKSQINALKFLTRCLKCLSILDLDISNVSKNVAKCFNKEKIAVGQEDAAKWTPGLTK